MDDTCDRHFQSQEEMWLRQRVTELERANERLQERLAALERERDALRTELAQTGSGRESVALALLDAITESVVVVDRSGVIRAVNRTAAERLGHSKEQLVGLDGRDPLCRIVPDDVRDARLARLDEVIRTGKPLRVADSRDGRTFDQTYYPVLDGSGQVSHVVLFATDVTEHRGIERAVRENEQMLRVLFDAVTESVLMLDTEGRILMLNETAARRFGRSARELVGVRLADVGDSVISQPVVDRRLQRIREVVNTRAPVQFEDDRINRRFFTSMYPILDQDGVVRRVAVFAKDVSEERSAQREVKGLQQQMEFILGTAKMGLDIIDSDFNVRYVDPAWQRVYGPYEGRKCYEYFMDQDRMCSGCAIPTALASGQRVVSDEVLVKEANRPIRVTTIPFQTDGGEWLVAEVNVDISDRLELERGLMESEERYRTVVESAGEAIAIVDEQGTFLFMNGTAARALGGKPSDFKGKTMWDLFPKDIADRQAGAVRRVIEAASGASSVVLSDVRGQMRWYNTTIQPLRDGTGRVAAGLVIARDVHELRTAQQELEANREKMMRAEQLASLGTLSATYAHEVNQPLTVIRLSLQNALKDLEGTACPTTVVEDLSDGLSEVSNITGIIERFRSLARQASDRPVTKVILAAAAGRVIRLLAESARKNRLRLAIEQLDDLPPIYACEKDIEQLFFALTQNAVQAADGARDRHFTITGVCQDGQIELRFVDDCGGIHPDIVGRVFDPFFTTKCAGEGTGLGLCIVQRVVSQAGGRVRVETRFGEGTTFIVTLPVDGG